MNLDFYNSLDRKNADENFHPANQKTERKLASAESVKSKTARRQCAPLLKVPSGDLVSLQVGAFSNASDAEKLAKTLRSKGYSVSLVSPPSGSGDKLVPNSRRSIYAPRRSQQGQDPASKRRL